MSKPDRQSRRQRVPRETITGVAGPAATDVHYAVPGADFQILSASATKGSMTASSSALDWTLSELRTESVTITYELEHFGSLNGMRPLHLVSDLSWRDSDGIVVTQSMSAAQIEVVWCNLPPAANAGPDQTVAMTGPAGATVLLDGSASSDDGMIQPLAYSWSEGANVLGSGAQLAAWWPSPVAGAAS